MEDLRNILESIASDDIKLKRDSTQQRRFIIAEGIYRNTGNICDLSQIVKLKNQFCYRLFLDETVSFGTLGATGRGLTEHTGLDINSVDILNFTMEAALGSVGGVCVGNREVIDHQRLSGAGYCFSASAPPFLSTVAIESLKLIESEPSRISKLRENIIIFRDNLKSLKSFTLSSSESCLLFLTLKESIDWDIECEVIESLQEKCLSAGIALSAQLDYPYLYNTNCIRPSLRIIVNACLSSEQINTACGKIRAICDEYSH